MSPMAAGDGMNMVRRCLAKVERVESDLAEARMAFWRALRDAHEEGIPLATLGHELGVTRQRVAQMIEQAD